MIGEMLVERRDFALAVAKYEEALESVGVENASTELLEGSALALEGAGRQREAISTYEAIWRRDAHRDDIAERIEQLKREIEASESPAAAATTTASAPPAESRYELVGEIGRGGMGVVYKARDKRLGRIVALKRLPENLREHPRAVELFEREARAAASLNHVNIVTLFDAGEENGSYFITMELLEGRPLNDILERRGRLGARDVARLGIQIATGLQCAHEQRIVHRDIKTANLFFTRDQVVKIGGSPGGPLRLRRDALPSRDGGAPLPGRRRHLSALPRTRAGSARSRREHPGAAVTPDPGPDGQASGRATRLGGGRRGEPARRARRRAALSPGRLDDNARASA
jgi:tRNA A-37 threonylcarbamoyl transferase component Bud32